MESTVIILMGFFLCIVIAVVLGFVSYRKMKSIVVVPLINFKEGAFINYANRRKGSSMLLSDIEQPGIELKDSMDPIFFTSIGEDGETKQEGRLEGAFAWGASTIDGLFPAGEVVLKWSSVDDHIFQAYEHLTHENIDNFADLLRLVDIEKYKFYLPGFQNMLRGHVGEFVVLEHLSEAGLDVEMPFASNEPGVDLTANGLEMNVKAVSNVSATAANHFENYPDIPIIVPMDARNIPTDAIHFDPSSTIDPSIFEIGKPEIYVDDALSLDGLDDQVSNATDVLGNPGPEGHIPWITLAFSVFREGNLLVKGNTNIQRSLKNILIDTSGVGGGGFIGMKAGGLVGAIGGPVGVVIGGVIGAFTGALGGRATSNYIKQKPLREAEKRYKSAGEVYSAAQADLSNVWQNVQGEEVEKLRVFGEEAKEKAKNQLGILRKQLDSMVWLDERKAKTLLASSRMNIEKKIEEERKELQKRVPFCFRPWAGLIAPTEAQVLASHFKEFRVWEKCAAEILKFWSIGEENTGRCFDLVLATPDGSSAVDQYLEDVDKMRMSVIEAAGAINYETTRAVVLKRGETVSRLSSRWQAFQEQVETTMSPIIEDLRSTGENFRSELRSFGVEC